MDMTDVIVENYQRTTWTAGLPRRRRHPEERAALKQEGLNIMTLPKTIDNDVAMTDVTLRLRHGHEHRHRGHRPPAHHRHSHHRIIVVEVMGHRAGWLALARASPAAPT